MGKVNKPRKKHNRKTPSRLSRPVNARTLRTAVTWAISGALFSSLKIHGNTTWQMIDLIALSMMWVWSDHRTLTGAFDEANRWSLNLLGRSAVGTYQGLMNALANWTPPVLALVKARFQQLMEEHGGEHFRIRGWVPIAVDGSRVSVPRTRENEAAFCAKNYGRSPGAKSRRKRAKLRRKRYRQSSEKRAPQRPQMWTTLLWHMGLKMPWSWRTGGTDSSERNHFEEVLGAEKFPENTLFCCDAGFVGYDLWNAMESRGHHFLIRVGANVRLIEELGSYTRETDGIVYLWPQQAMANLQPPVVLRRISIRIGKAEIELVTNVLGKSRLTDRQAKQFYRMRWGVELQFRALKQTFERRVLKSRTPDRARVELDWSLLGLWLIQLVAVRKQIGLGRLPERCSVGLAINVIREAFRQSLERPALEWELSRRLCGAVTDSYVRKKPKKGRRQPDSARKPSCGKPRITRATRVQRNRLKAYLAGVP